MKKEFIFFIISVLHSFSMYSQSIEMEFVYFGEKGYSDIDQALSAPKEVEALYFSYIPDSVLNKTIEKIKKNANAFANLYFIQFDYHCNFDTIPFELLNLPSLRVITSNGRPTIYQKIPQCHALNLVKIDLSCPKSINDNDWQLIFYDMLNLKSLSLSFNNTIKIDEKITKLEKLEKLRLHSQGNIIFSDSLDIGMLKTFDLSQCLKCQDFPDYLPASIERINISHTKIKKMSNNIIDLHNLKYIELGNSCINSFPNDFNFGQLLYFSAPKDLLTPEKWSEIRTQVKRIVVGTDRQAAKETYPYDKRN